MILFYPGLRRNIELMVNLCGLSENDDPDLVTLFTFRISYRL